MEYIVDNNGTKTAVLIPFKKWEAISKDIAKMKKKIDVMSGIEEGFKEIKSSKKIGKDLQTLSEFLIRK